MRRGDRGRNVHGGCGAAAPSVAGHSQREAADSGRRPRPAAPRGAGISLQRYAAQRLPSHGAADGDFPPGAAEPDCHERPPGESGTDAGAEKCQKRLFLPAQTERGGGRHPDPGIMHHPAAQKHGHSAGADSGAVPHPQGGRWHRRAEQNAASRPEPRRSRQKGARFRRYHFPGGGQGDADPQQL